jgi:uncharacterized membrane protein
MASFVVMERRAGSERDVEFVRDGFHLLAFIFPLFWELFWGVVIFAFFRARGRRGRWDAGQSGEGVLAERYARVVIAEQEYRERLGVLKGTRS